MVKENIGQKKLIGQAAKTEKLMKKIDAAWAEIKTKNEKAKALAAKKGGLAKFFEEHSSGIGQAALYFFGAMTGSLPFLLLGATLTHVSGQEKQASSSDKKPK